MTEEQYWVGRGKPSGRALSFRLAVGRMARSGLRHYNERGSVTNNTAGNSMQRLGWVEWLSVAFVALMLAGCGGGGSDGNNGNNGNNQPRTIGGTVSGLNGTVVLQNNGGNNLSVTANGNFTFANTLASGTTYNVTVLTQPAGQTCAVTSGSGTANANVTNVAVACTATTVTIGGAVSGLTGTVVLQNNGGNDLSRSANGAFTFTTALASGAAYDVTVLTQPAGQTCTVANGAGTANANVSNVAVSCTNNAVTIGGTVSGLTAGTLLLQNNLGDNLSVTTGTFTFPTAIASGSPYFVSVLVQPATLTCTVAANGSGTSVTNVSNVQIACVDNAVATVTVGGTVSGLGGGGSLTLRNVYVTSGGVVTKDMQVSSNGAFTFPAMPIRSFFTVTALAQPVGQTCSVFNNIGSPLVDITNVVVDCTNGTTVHTVGGTVSGLTKSGLFLTLSANNNVLPVVANAGQFTFPIGLTPGTEFQVGIALQPQGMTCVATNTDGSVETANVTDVAIACIDNTTDPLVGTYAVVGTDVLITLFPDGTYVLASRENDPDCGPSNGNGIELGVYNYNNATGGFAVVSNAIDTNGECGLWDGSPGSGTVQKSGVGQGSSLTFTAGADSFTLVAVPSVANTFLGSFRLPGATAFLVLGDDGHYTLAHTGDNDTAGIEYGCYAITGTTSGTITPDVTPATCPGTVDTNDDAGLSDADGTPLPYTVLGPYVVEAFERVLFRIVPN